MSPLDAARRLVESNSECANRLCHYCGSPGKLRGTEGSCHAPDCPWLAMPRIVAALEAADEFLTMSYDRVFDVDYTATPRPHRCRVCLAEESPYVRLDELQHQADCRFAALVAALKGVVVP